MKAFRGPAINWFVENGSGWDRGCRSRLPSAHRSVPRRRQQQTGLPDRPYYPWIPCANCSRVRLPWGPLRSRALVRDLRKRADIRESLATRPRQAAGWRQQALGNDDGKVADMLIATHNVFLPCRRGLRHCGHEARCPNRSRSFERATVRLSPTPTCESMSASTMTRPAATSTITSASSTWPGRTASATPPSA